MACSTIRSAGAACCGLACCRRCPCSTSAASSRSAGSGSKTGAASAPNREVARRCQHFQARVLGNTLTACWWMASGFVLYYSVPRCSQRICKRIWASARPWSRPRSCSSISSSSWRWAFWGWVGDALGRRWAMIIPALIAVPLAPLYLFSTDIIWIASVLSSRARRRRHVRPDTELSERAVPDRGAGDGKRLLLPPRGNLGRLCAVGADLLRRQLSARLRCPDDGGHRAAAISFVIALLFSPETKGKG